MQLIVNNLVSPSFASSVQPLSITFPLSKRILWITGASGSGKTTLLSLLSGFMNPTSGSITLVDPDISSARNSLSSSFHSSFAYVPQYPSDINSTLYEFVSEGSSDSSTYDNFISILERIGLLEQISLTSDVPVTSSFLLGSGGYHLSGGQNKIFHLCRALSYTDAPLIFFDEPTSGVSHNLLASVMSELRKSFRAFSSCYRNSRDFTYLIG